MKTFFAVMMLGFSFNLFAQSADSTRLKAFTLNTFPPNTHVYSGDGSLLGKTPLILDFSSIKTPVTLKKNGYEDSVFDNKTSQSIIEMKPVSMENYSYKIEKNLWFRSDNDQKIWIALGGILVSGVVAAHYKFEASNQFRKYTETKDQRYMDLTNKYDSISAIGFGGMQISFGYLVYVLIWE